VNESPFTFAGEPWRSAWKPPRGMNFQTLTMPDAVHEQITASWERWDSPLKPDGSAPFPIRQREEESRWAFHRRYLRTKRWKYTKFIRGAVTLPQVCFCGKRWDLDAHHVTYERLGNEALEDLVFLCREHHDAVERFYRRQRSGLSLAEATEWVGLDLWFGRNQTGELKAVA